MSDLTILGFAGSLRESSFNRALLRTAGDLLPDEVHFDEFDVAGLPFFDADVEAEGDPEVVAEFKRRIAAADGVLIATPEYMHAIPGVLKNALDWASRPAGRSGLTGKPVAIMGASPSPVGTARAQLQLRQALIYLDADLVSKPEVLISFASDKFDGGRLVDDAGREFLGKLLDRFVTHIRER